MYLNCHSYYSLRYGTLSIEELTHQAKELGLKSLALTDINSSQGMMDFIKSCNENDIQPIAGIEFRHKHQLLYIGIAKNNQGFKELNDFLSQHNLTQSRLPEEAPAFEHVWVIYPFSSTKTVLNTNEYVGVKIDEVPRLSTSVYKNYLPKLVVLHPVSLKTFNDMETHLCLRAIDENVLLSQVNKAHAAGINEVFYKPEELSKAFKDYPQLIENTQHILNQARVGINFKKPKNKQVFSKNRDSDKRLLEKIAIKGLKHRYKRGNKEAERRVNQELKVINEMGFNAYFLIAWDIIQYAKSKGIYHVGRGSGANSIVAYCLQITDVDPIELDLYFERFINKKRTSPPDFDIDFSWKDRTDIQAYLFKKYGKNHVALLGATTTFKDKAIFRELGKVYGLPKAEIDKLVSTRKSQTEGDHITDRIYAVGHRIMDFPNIRSIHAGGVLISEEPISNYTALDLPPKGFATTQWDMYVGEMINFEKFDILSQRGIGHIQECAELVHENKGIRVDVHQVASFKKDPKVNERLFHGDAIGCFYIESPAMRGLLKKLKCNNYLSLVAASSIIRPGVAKSGMMKEYIKRFHNPEGFHYLHPIFKEQLEETYGVMVYQEDVIKICHHFAGLDLTDADILRRAMSGKFRSKKEFQRIQDTFFDNCWKKGHSVHLTNEVWRQIASFAGYAFSKAHSASYAVESYQSLYLKTYYPLEFMVAVINNFGGFYATWLYINEARVLGATIEIPCVNNSKQLTSIQDSTIYLGFVHLKSFENKAAQQILKERSINGPFTGLNDFIERLNLGLEQLKILIRVGALRFTNKSKSVLLWEAHLYYNKQKSTPYSKALFTQAPKSYELPNLSQASIEDAYDEIEFLGFPVSLTRIDMIKTTYRGNTMANELMSRLGKRVRMVGDLVTIKNVHTVKREWMHFGCFIDQHGQFFDTVNFPPSLKNYPFTGYGVYLIEGRVVEEFGFPSIEVEKMARLAYQPDPRFVSPPKTKLPDKRLA